MSASGIVVRPEHFSLYNSLIICYNKVCTIYYSRISCGHMVILCLDIIVFKNTPKYHFGIR